MLMSAPSAPGRYIGPREGCGLVVQQPVDDGGAGVDAALQTCG